MNMRSRPERARPASDEVRARLLDAAETLLTERRPIAITSRDIARSAGLSDGVLYNHFADKHELLLAALVRRFDRITAAYNADAVQPGVADVVDGLRTVVRRAHAVQVALLPMLANLVGDPALLERFLVEIHRTPLGGEHFTGPVRRFLEGERDAGRVGVVDLEGATDLIVGAVLLQGLLDVLGHRAPEDRDRRLDSIASALLSGLQPTAEVTS